MNLIEIHIILSINHWNQNIRPGNLGSAARPGSGFYTPPFDRLKSHTPFPCSIDSKKLVDATILHGCSYHVIVCIKKMRPSLRCFLWEPMSQE